jgi:hypothetical protein
MSSVGDGVGVLVMRLRLLVLVLLVPSSLFSLRDVRKSLFQLSIIM